MNEKKCFENWSNRLTDDQNLIDKVNSVVCDHFDITFHDVLSHSSESILESYFFCGAESHLVHISVDERTISSSAYYVL